MSHVLRDKRFKVKYRIKTHGETIDISNIIIAQKLFISKIIAKYFFHFLSYVAPWENYI